MPLGADMVMVVPVPMVEVPVQPVVALAQDNVEVVEPIVTIHVVELHGIELELGFEIVIVYVKLPLPEVVLVLESVTVGVLEVLVVKNPVRAR